MLKGHCLFSESEERKNDRQKLLLALAMAVPSSLGLLAVVLKYVGDCFEGYMPFLNYHMGRYEWENEEEEEEETDEEEEGKEKGKEKGKEEGAKGPEDKGGEQAEGMTQSFSSDEGSGD